MNGRSALVGTAAIAVATILMAQPASAGNLNLLTNGSFETGDLSGWNLHIDSYGAYDDEFWTKVVSSGFDG
jgi:hypothetical protein